MLPLNLQQVPRILQLLHIVLSSSYCNTSTKAEHDWCIKHLGEKKLSSVPVILEKKRGIYFIFYPDAQGSFCSNDLTLLINKVFKMKFLRHVFSNGNWKVSYVTVSTCLVCPCCSHSNPWIYLKSKSVPTHCIPLWLILSCLSCHKSHINRSSCFSSK